MARLRVPAPNFYTSAIAPTGTELHHYAKIAGGVDSGTTLNTTGQSAIDVWSCLLARCREWTLTISGSYSDPGDSSSGAFSGAVTMEAGLYDSEFAITSYPSQTGYAAHPEVTTATALFLEAANGTQGGLGSWSSPSTPSGSFDVMAFADYRPAATFGVPWTGPLVVGSDLYIPFRLRVDTFQPGDGITFPWQTVPETGWDEVGTLTIQITNWRGVGLNTLTLPIWGVIPSGGSASFSATMEPVSGSYMLYGSEADNSNPRWNSDGTVNGLPGD